MRRKPLWPRIAVGMGIAAVLFGLLGVGGYGYWAVIERVGEPDQSLLFWYLPFLLVGVFALGVGVSATVWGLLGLRRAKAEAAVAGSKGETR